MIIHNEAPVESSSADLPGRPTGPRHLDFERVVEAVEIIEEANDADQFDELPFVVMRGDGVPYLIGDVTVAPSDRIGQPKRGGFLRLQVRLPRFRRFQRIQVLLRGPVAPCQGAMTGRSILALIQYRHTNGQ